MVICCFIGTEDISAQKKRTLKDGSRIAALKTKTSSKMKYDISKYLMIKGDEMRPSKNFKMIYSKSLKGILVIPVATKPSEVSGRDGSMDIVDGIQFRCASHCTSGCTPSVIQAGGDGSTFGCVNHCDSCIGWVYIPTKKNLQYMTPDGNDGWDDF